MSTITFGALAPPLCEQLGVPPARVALHQKQADAITRLLVAGLLTDGEAHRARARLVKHIALSAPREDSDGR